VLIKAGKGNKDRMVPLGDRALAWIEKYLNDVHPLLITAQYRQHLFLTDYGEPFNRGVLSVHVRKLLDRAGIDKPGSCHLLRHACATHMLENGADIRYIQALLGHEDLNSTQIYTQVSIEKLKEIHAATHPAKLKTKTDTQGEASLALLATLEWEAEQEQESDGNYATLITKSAIYIVSDKEVNNGVCLENLKEPQRVCYGFESNFRPTG